VTSVTGQSLGERLAARLRGAIQLEDLLLAAVIVVLPLLRDGGSIGATAGFLGDTPDVLGGLFAIAGAVGAIVCIATRVPGTSRLDAAHAAAPEAAAGPAFGFRPDARMAIIGPYLGGVALVGAHGFEKLGIRGGDWLAGPAFVVGVGAFIFADRLPVVDAWVRRTLVTPFVLVAGGIFEGIVGDLTPEFDPLGAVGALLAGRANELTGLDTPSAGGLLLFSYGFVIAGTGVFYAMLVYAPRELAVSHPTPRGVWPVRFVLFLVAVVVGARLP
jgi:hypothetical protein